MGQAACLIMLTVLYWVVTPITLSKWLYQLKKEQKRLKRKIKRHMRDFRKYGFRARPRNKESSFRQSASFITDKMLSSEDEVSTSASSSSAYSSQEDYKYYRGIQEA